MYKIIYKCRESIIIHSSGWPGDMIENFFKEGFDLIVISTYSNTIKIPYFDEDGDILWKEFSFAEFPSKGPDDYLNYLLSKDA